MIHVNTSVKNIACAKDMIVRILIHVFVRIVGIQNILLILQ